MHRCLVSGREALGKVPLKLPTSFVQEEEQVESHNNSRLLDTGLEAIDGSYKTGYPYRAGSRSMYNLQHGHGECCEVK